MATNNVINNALGVATAVSINFGASPLKTYKAETSFTPTITFATPGDLTVSYSQQTGFYTEIGNIIFIDITLGFTPTYTTASGALRISSLPTTATDSNFFLGVSLAQAFTFPIGTSMLAGASGAGESYLTIIASGSGVVAANITTTQLVTATGYFLYLSGFYTNTSL